MRNEVPSVINMIILCYTLYLYSNKHLFTKLHKLANFINKLTLVPWISYKERNWHIYFDGFTRNVNIGTQNSNYKNRIKCESEATVKFNYLYGIMELSRAYCLCYFVFII